MLSFQWKDQIYISGQLENVVVTLAYGDYNGNYSLVDNPENGILNVIFFVGFISKLLDMSSVHTDINIKAVCVLKLHIHLLVSFFRNIV